MEYLHYYYYPVLLTRAPSFLKCAFGFVVRSFLHARSTLGLLILAVFVCLCESDTLRVGASLAPAKVAKFPKLAPITGPLRSFYFGNFH